MNLTKTKKIIAAGLSALMMMCSATPVFAAESGNKSANLNYQVSSSYDWIIHSSIDFGADAGVGKTVDRTGNQVKVLKNVIPEGKYLNISVKGSGANDVFTVDNGGSEILNYDVSDDNGAVGVNGNVLSVPAGTNTATQNMGFKLNTTKKSAEVAGQYTGRVIYNASVGEQYKVPLDKKNQSSRLVSGTEFNTNIPSTTTSVLFCDEKAPDGVETVDLTVDKNNDVVGWLDGATWKVSTQNINKKVLFNEDSSKMFQNKEKLTNIQLDNIDTSDVSNMSYMFGSCKNLTSLDVSNLNTSKTTNMNSMFYDCRNLNSLDVTNFNTSNVTDMSNLFKRDRRLTQLDVSSFDTSKVTTMKDMFSDCSQLTSLDVSNFDTSNVTNMWGMFSTCPQLTSLDVSNFNTSKVTDMHAMFSMSHYGDSMTWADDFEPNENPSKLTNLKGLENFDTSAVRDMGFMFHGCTSLTSLDLSNFNTSKVKDMSIMFENCCQLSSVNISNFDTANVTDMGWMFDCCENLTSLNISNFDISKVTSMTSMLQRCKKLAKVFVRSQTYVDKLKSKANAPDNVQFAIKN